MEVDTTAGTTGEAVATTTGEIGQSEGSASEQTTQSTAEQSSAEEPNWDELIAKAPKDKLKAVFEKDEDFRKDVSRNVRHSEIARRAEERAKEIAAAERTRLTETETRLADLQRQLDEARMAGMTDEERAVHRLQQERDQAKTQLSKLQTAFQSIEEAVARDEAFEKLKDDYELSDEEVADLNKQWDKYANDSQKAGQTPSPNRLLHMAGLIVKERGKTAMSGVEKTIAELTAKVEALSRVNSGASVHAATAGSGGSPPATDIEALEALVVSGGADSAAKKRYQELLAKRGINA